MTARKTVTTDEPDRGRTGSSTGQSVPTAQTVTPDASKRKRNIALGVGAAVVAVIVLIIGAAEYKKHRLASLPEVHKLQVAQYDWHDAKRSREITAKVYRPADASGPAPAVIFSHAAGGSQTTAEYLSRYWAAHGYVSVFIQHQGPDSPAKKDGFLPGAVVRDAVQKLSLLVERIRDAHFAVDQLERMNRDDKGFKGGIDLERIGMAGNAQGALTTLAVAGASVTLPHGKEESFVDHRIKAALAMSLPVSPRLKPVMSRVMTGVKIPCLHVSGTADRGPAGETRVEDRRLVFDNITAADQYLILFKNADHTVFAGQQSDGEKAAATAAIQDLVCVSSTAFWDAYLKGDAKAKEWLCEGGLESKLGDLGTLEKKLAK